MAAPAVVGEYAPRGVGGKLYIPEAAAAASDTEEESGSDDDSKPSSDSEAGEGGEGEEEEEEEGDYDGEYGDDSGWWDGDGIYHGDGGDGGGEYRYGDHGYGADGEHMLWTCAVCTVSVNIFARDDHITSRPHIRAVRKLATESAAATAGAGADPAYIPPVWRCAVCVQDMSVFLREEHVLGKEHQRRIRLANGPLDPADLDLRDTAAGEYVSDEAIAAAMVFADTLPPPRFESTEYALRATFYCAVCAGEFDLSSEEQHLDDAETWSCKVCGTAVHAAGQETHEDSDRHKIVAGMQAPQLDAFHCAVCRRFYSPAEKAAHLAGAEHAQMLARVELETQYMLRLEELRKKTAPQAAKGKESQDQGDRQTACNLCREPLMGLSVDRHLQSICPAVMRTGEAQNIPGSVQDRGSCRLCGEPLMGLSAESHRKMFCAAVTRTPGPVKPTPTKPGKKKAPPTKPGKKKAPPNPNVYNCRVCKCGVAMEEKAYHLASETHKKKAAKRARKKAAKFAAAQAAVAQAAAAGLAPPPKPKKGRRRKKKKVYCDVCKTHRSASGIADHMAGQKHQCKLAALQQTGGQNAMPAPPPPPTQEAPSAEPTAPQPAPALSVNYNPAHITIMGDKFHCKMCVRDRLLIGLEDHLRSGGHRRRKAQLAG